MLTPFSGTIDAAFIEDVHALYVHRNPLFPIGYGAMGMVMLGLGVYRGSETAIGDSLFFGVAAASLLTFAFALPQIGWKWWWPRFESEFGPNLFGEITSDGIRWAAEPEPIPWSAFIAIKADERAALLYISKLEALPLHRSMFTDSEWQTALSLLPGKNRPPKL